MVHGSEMISPHGPEKRIERPQDVLRTGQEIAAKVVEVDSAKRQIRLSMKQLVPTGLDEYLAEHRPGDVVTARILKVDKTSGMLGGGLARVELGEGIYATCELPASAASPDEAPKSEGTLDLSALTSMLNSKWKGATTAAKAATEIAQPGQIRQFRITALDGDKKSITVELIR